MSVLALGQAAERDWFPVLSESLQAFLSEADDRPKLLGSIVQHVCRVGDVDCDIGLWQLEADERRLARCSDVQHTSGLLDTPLLRETRVLKALATGRALLLPSEDSKQLELSPLELTEHGLACLACLPLCTTTRNWGVVVASRRDGQEALSSLELRLLQHLADRAAIALEHGQTLADARKALAERQRLTERFRLLAQASRDFAAATSDYRHLLDVVAQTVGQCLGDLCSIRLVSRDGQWLNGSDASIFHPDPAVIAAFRAVMQETPQRADSGLAGEVVSSGRPLRRSFLSQPHDLANSTLPQFRPLLALTDIASLMLLPLMSHGRCLGVLSLSRGRDKPDFDDDDLQLAADFADRAALAVENAALLVDLRARVAEIGQAEERFRRLLESAPDAIVLVDDAGKIALVNAQTEKLFGHARSELIGRPASGLIASSSREQLASFPTRAATVTGVELSAVRKDGGEFAAEINFSPIETRDGHFVMAVIRDATERRRLEEARARAHELEADNRRAHEASRLKSEFLANMSHELRTPLNAIIGFSSLLHAGRAGALSSTQVEYVGDILTSSHHLLQLINDVLDLAKIESGRLDIRPQRIDVLRTVSEVRDILRGLAAEKSIHISIDVQPDVDQVFTDPRLLKQILYNYLSNAIKFTPELGSVKVKIEAAARERFAVKVTDTGIGIRQQDQSKLFEVFEQLDVGSSKIAQHGTGLGLALTRRIVEAQGGSVSVRSTFGEGSEFIAELPRHQGAEG